MSSRNNSPLGSLFVLSVLLVSLIGSAPLYGQDSRQSRGEIRLQVTDQTGAVLKASGRLIGPEKTNRTFQTDIQGISVVSDLAFGRYRVELFRSGFASRT